MSARPVVLALAIAAALAIGAASARGGGGGRMAVASVSAVNAGARVGAGRPDVPARPIDGDSGRVIYNPYGWYWYGEYPGEPAAEPEPEPRPAAPPSPPPPPPSVGTTVPVLPAGCSTVERGGRFLRSCGGAFYEEKFEGDRIVYTVVQ